jgi:hypothetical protein
MTENLQTLVLFSGQCLDYTSWIISVDSLEALHRISPGETSHMTPRMAAEPRALGLGIHGPSSLPCRMP